MISKAVSKAAHIIRFATKTFYVRGFRYNFSNPVICFCEEVKYHSIVEENKFLVIDPKVSFVLAQMVMGRVNFALYIRNLIF